MYAKTHYRALFCGGFLVVVSAGIGAPAQEVIGEGPIGNLKPLLVCPPRFSTPLVVSAEEVLDAAERAQPLTDEGWIVRHRPVANCLNYVGDAETRAHALYEYPLQLRRYESQIRLAEAELASWQRRLAEYRYFNKAGGLFVTVENTQLAVQAAQARVRDLRYERMLFLRLHNLERQLQQVTAAP